MAKTIKAIECPKCGSVKKHTRPDGHFVCKNCHTEYLLDDNVQRIEIVEHGTPPVDEQTFQPWLALGVAVFVILSLALPYLTTFFVEGSQGAAASKRAEYYTENPYEVTAFDDAEDGRPILAIMTHRRPPSRADGESTARGVVRFYDVKEGAFVSEEPLEDVPEPWGEIRTFADGRRYFIPKDTARIFVFGGGGGAYFIEDITDAFFAQHAEFAAGVATLRFGAELHGDAVEILTDDGKEYRYYPIADLLYPKDEQPKDAVLGDGKTITRRYFGFEEHGDTPVLYTRTWEEAEGYPNGMKHALSKRRRLGINGRKKAEGWQNLTPDRTYFRHSILRGPQVLAQDGNDVYIGVMATADPKSPTLIQKLDGESGELVWSHDAGTFAEYLRFATVDLLQEGVAYGTVSQYVVLDNNGEQVTAFDPRELLRDHPVEYRPKLKESLADADTQRNLKDLARKFFKPMVRSLR